MSVLCGILKNYILILTNFFLKIQASKQTLKLEKGTYFEYI